MSGIVQTVNKLNYSKELTDEGSTKLTIEVPNERFSVYVDKAYKKLAPTVEVSGFRKGKAPRNVVASKLGASLYEEALKSILPECTLEIVRHTEIKPLTRISYNVEKMAEGSGVKFSATFVAFPEFDLPDIKKIKVKKEDTKVTDKEVETVIERMYKERTEAQDKAVENKSDSKNKDKAKKKDDKKKKEKKDENQKMDDEWAASLKLGVKDLKGLKKKIREELEKQKESLEQNKYISDIIKKIVEKSDFEIPQALVESQLDRKEKEYKARIESLGMEMEDFLKSKKTTMKKLKEGWKKDISEQIKSEVILSKVAQEYDIEIKEEEIEQQIEKIQDEKLKEQYSSAQGKNYVRSIVLQKKVVDKLLSLVKEK